MPRTPVLSRSAAALRESIFSRLAGSLASHPDAVPLHLGGTYLRLQVGLDRLAQHLA